MKSLFLHSKFSIKRFIRFAHDDARDIVLHSKNAHDNSIISALTNSNNHLIDVVLRCKNETLAEKDKLLAEKDNAAKILSAERDKLLSKVLESEHLRLQLTLANKELLEAKGLLSVRGALEFCRGQLLSRGNSTADFQISDKGDKIFSALEGNKDFKKLLKDTCERKKNGSKYITNALTGIWSTASKHYHGRESSVAIHASTYSPDECIVLVVIFSWFNIPFQYYNKRGGIVDFFEDKL